MGFLAADRPESDDIEAYLLRQWRVMCGRGFVFDDDVWSARIASWVARGHNPRCPIVFGSVPYEKTVEGRISDLDERTAIVRRISAPTLVMHGDDDGMFTPGDVPPAEFEADYYARTRTEATVPTPTRT